MPNEPKKVIPLNYARPGTPVPRSQPAPNAAAPGLNRGLLRPDEVAVSLFQTSDRGDMAFVTRALDQLEIEYCVADVPAGQSYKHPLALRVRESDAERAKKALEVILARRQRVKSLNKKKPDGFKTVTEGGTWPDPYTQSDRNGFLGF